MESHHVTHARAIFEKKHGCRLAVEANGVSVEKCVVLVRGHFDKVRAALQEFSQGQWAMKDDEVRGIEVVQTGDAPWATWVKGAHLMPYGDMCNLRLELPDRE